MNCTNIKDSFCVAEAQLMQNMKVCGINLCVSLFITTHSCQSENGKRTLLEDMHTFSRMMDGVTAHALSFTSPQQQAALAQNPAPILPICPIIILPQVAQGAAQQLAAPPQQMMV